jgi:NADP-dependent 3-hydroxy acid dehydrogenase YdfG
VPGAPAIATGYRVPSQPGHKLRQGSAARLRRVRGASGPAARMAPPSLAAVRALDPQDVARMVTFVLEQPAHVNIDEIMVSPLRQDF